MKLILAQIATALAQFDSSSSEATISVTVTSTDEYISAGSNTTLTCSWALPSDGAADYTVDDFTLYWKLDADKMSPQTLISYRGGDNTITYKNKYNDNVEFTGDFDGQSALLHLSDIQIDHDNYKYACEIHWGQVYGESETSLTVYKNADAIELVNITSILEGRDSLVGNDTVEAAESFDVASCTVRGIYPEPTTVTFLVNDEEVVVAADGVESNGDKTFDASATLNLAAKGQYNGAEISCVSVAAPTAASITNDDEDSFDLEVFYYTDDATLVVTGGNEKMGDGEYAVIEGQSYSVRCVANGNPAPVVEIRNADGVTITEDEDIVATRGDLFEITCQASNAETNSSFTLGDEIVDVAQIDVYYIDDPTTGGDTVGEYDEEYTNSCSALGNPAPRIQWTRASSTTVISHNQLNLGKLTYSSAGEYLCTADNAAGSTSKSFQLEVDGPCVVRTEDPVAGQAGEGLHAALNIVCLVDGPDNDACKVDWKVSEELTAVFATADISPNSGGSTLSFANLVKLSAPTTFTCEATNSRGTQFANAVVNEEHEPACCQPSRQASLGTGAIVGIVIAIPAILIILGAAVFFCRKQQQDKDDTCVEEGDDAADAEKQPLQASEPDREGGDAGDDAV